MRLNLLTNLTIILTNKKAIDVIDITDNNLTIDKSIPYLRSICDRKSTFVAK